MPSLRIPKTNKDAFYFVTFTVKNWYYLFDRHNRFELLEESFAYCQDQKGLRIFSFVFMLNHLHFIGTAPDLSATIRDMKHFLSKELQKNIIATEPNILRLFKNSKGNDYSMWREGNYPEMIESEKFFLQKIQYIHFNPVRKGYVHNPEDWKWSSASTVPTKIHLSHF